MIDSARLDENFEKFYKDLNQLALFSEKTSGEMLWKYAGRFVAVLVAKTRPRQKGRGKMSKSAIDVGEGAVLRDIRKVYPSPGTLWKELERKVGEGGADRYWALYRAGKTSELEAMFRSAGIDCQVIAWDSGKRHGSEKLNMMQYKKHMPRRSLVINDQNVKEYIAKIQRRVMWAKAGWISGYRPPGGGEKLVGISEFVTRHRAAPGRVRDLTRLAGRKKAIIFENHVEYIAYLFSWQMAESTCTHIGKLMGQDLQKAIVQYSKG